MKYYAVTEDPRELFHYGVKGMKWGQHLFGDDLKPKSAAYKRAAGKLRSTLTKGLNSIKVNAKVGAEQRAIKRRAKEQNRYMREVQKTQQKMQLLDNLSTLDNEKAYYKSVAKEQKARAKQNMYANKIASANNIALAAQAKNNYKQAKKAAKAEKRMDKLMQEAREGRLRYGQLSDEQISRVQQRLNAEEQARKLGGREKPSWRQQKKEARRAGKLQGITRGTAAAMEEIARAGATFGINHVLDRVKLRSAAKQEGKETRARRRQENKKTHRDVKRELKQDLYEEQVKSGVGAIRRTVTLKTTKRRANALRSLQDQNKLRNEYQAYLDENNLTDKQARRLYRDSLSDNARENFGGIRGPRKQKTIAAQQRKLLASVNKQKDAERRDEQFKDKLYERYVMGGKGSSPEDILARYKDTNAYESIYGKKRSKHNVTSNLMSGNSAVPKVPNASSKSN